MTTLRLALALIPLSFRAPTIIKRISRAPSIAMALGLPALALPAATGASMMINFDAYPGGGVVPPGLSISDQWKSLGVIFSDQAGGPVGAANNSCSLSAPNHAYANTIVATFVDPSTGAPALTDYVGTAQDNCWVPGEGIAMRVYDINGALLGSIFNPPSGVPGNGHFEAFSFSSAIVARIEMDCILQGIDNFVFDSPTVLGVDDQPVVFAMRPLMNPSLGGQLTVAFSLASSTAAKLELLDVSGRRAAARDVGSLGPGHHQVQLGEDRPLRSGIYFVRLSQGPNVIVARVAILD